MQDKIVTPQASSLYASFFNRGNQIQKRRYLQAQVTYQIKARPRRYKISRYASFFYGGIHCCFSEMISHCLRTIRHRFITNDLSPVFTNLQTVCTFLTACSTIK